MKTYGRQVQTNPVLWRQYVEAYQIATGQPFPTEKVPETVGIPGQRVGEGGLSRFLAPQGTQQIPTGRTIERPILPQAEPAPMQRIVFTDARGQVVNVLDVPQGTQIRQVQGEPGTKTVAILDASGNIVKTIELPPGGAVHQLPRPTPAGGAVSTEGLTPAQKRTVDSYNRLVDQRTRLQQMIAQGVADAPMQARLQADIADLDRRIGQLQPEVDRILGIGGTAPPPAGGKKTMTMDEVRAVAQAEGKSVDAVIAAAKAQGYTIQAEKPKPTTQGMADFVRNLVRTRRGITWPQARILIIQELRRRGFSPQDAAKLADTQGKQAYGGAAAGR